MPTPKRGPRLGGGAAHQRHLLANQASDLFRHGRITTTQAKAKQLRPYAERLITKAKQGDLASRRAVLAKLRGDRDVVAYLFEEVAPRFADRNGGYTRTLKLGPRQGDNTPMVIIELVDRGTTSGDEAIEEAKAGRSRGLFGRRRKATADTGGAPAGTSVLADDDEDEDDAEASGLAAQAAPGEDAPPVPEDTLESDPAGTEGPDGPKHGGKDADTGTV